MLLSFHCWCSVVSAGSAPWHVSSVAPSGQAAVQGLVHGAKACRYLQVGFIRRVDGEAT
jgi:hypothetical protein